MKKRRRWIILGSGAVVLIGTIILFPPVGSRQSIQLPEGIFQEATIFGFWDHWFTVTERAVETPVGRALRLAGVRCTESRDVFIGVQISGVCGCGRAYELAQRFRSPIIAAFVSALARSDDKIDVEGWCKRIASTGWNTDMEIALGYAGFSDRMTDAEFSKWYEGAKSQLQSILDDSAR